MGWRLRYLFGRQWEHRLYPAVDALDEHGFAHELGGWEPYAAQRIQPGVVQVFTRRRVGFWTRLRRVTFGEPASESEPLDLDDPEFEEEVTVPRELRR